MAGELRHFPPRIKFNAEGYAEGWHFAVHAAFKRALDIVFTERKGELVETEGNPPVYGFQPGDTFYDAPEAYSAPWPEFVKKTKLAVQVLDVNVSMVRFRLMRPDAERARLEGFEVRTLEVEAFVEFLKSGQLPPREDEA